jgi:predicted ATPase with chaperone activity
MATSQVDNILEDILGDGSGLLKSSMSTAVSPTRGATFPPREPRSLSETGLPEMQVESLILKYLLNCDIATGRQIAMQVCLPPGLIFVTLRRLKAEQLVVYRGSCGLDDYEHELTPTGYERARRLYEQFSYFGAAPVTLDEYRASVSAQSALADAPTADSLREALKELRVHDDMFSQLGQAISSVGAIFLYGSPGNGKTSIAERLTNAFGRSIWVPRSIYIGGEVSRFYDPTIHEALPDSETESETQAIDRRWVHIRRPTVIVGGELSLENLEFRADRFGGAMEAPLHMKSNCGTLVIDDFGRQHVSTKGLLNRWIVPLEKRFDFLNTPAGRKIQVPFDQLVVFATNLEPRELVDEAFLRRIPYKIEAADPTEDDFRKLFRELAAKLEIAHSDGPVEYLITKHYHDAGRPFRFCHVRDLLIQVRNHCRFHEQEPAISEETIDSAVKNYFAIM